MATDKSSDSGKNLPWAGKKVRLEQVEDELTSLWHLASDNMRISQNMNVRTSVLNLVICALDAKSAFRASALLRDLSSIHIARVTLLILDLRSDAPEEASTWVTLRSFPIVSDIMRHHFEQVTVRLSGSTVQAAYSTVQSLLKPDLPAYLWWVNDLPSSGSLFQRLISISNRVIVDSSVFSQPEARVRSLSAVLRAAPQSALSDLNWGRVTPWRELVAQFFDIADYRPFLVRTSKIEIEHAVSPPNEPYAGTMPSASPNPTRALFLAAWLKSRLGWQISASPSDNRYDLSTGTYSWHMSERVLTNALSGPLASARSGLQDEATSSIDIFLRPRVQSRLRPGNICLVRLTTTLHGSQAIFTIDRDDNDHVLTSVELPDGSHPERTVSLAATHKEIEMLAGELEIMGHDYLYEETLDEVFSLLPDN